MHSSRNQYNWLPFLLVLPSLPFLLLSDGQQMHCPLLRREGQCLILIFYARMHILFNPLQIGLIIGV